MAEKVTIGNCELWHGDCREILPTLPGCDLILTDPPYGIGWSIGANPNGPTKNVPGRINWPVVCGGVTVNPGDLIVGDLILGGVA